MSNQQLIKLVVHIICTYLSQSLLLASLIALIYSYPSLAARVDGAMHDEEELLKQLEPNLPRQLWSFLYFHLMTTMTSNLWRGTVNFLCRKLENSLFTALTCKEGITGGLEKCGQDLKIQFTYIPKLFWKKLLLCICTRKEQEFELIAYHSLPYFCTCILV